MANPFATQVARGLAVKLGVDRRHQYVESIGFANTPLLEPKCYFRRPVKGLPHKFEVTKPRKTRFEKYEVNYFIIKDKLGEKILALFFIYVALFSEGTFSRRSGQNLLDEVPDPSRRSKERHLQKCGTAA